MDKLYDADGNVTPATVKATQTAVNDYFSTMEKQITSAAIERRFYGRMASKYKLITTGGSDFHDYVHGVDLGLKSFNPSNYTRTILGI